MSFALTEGASSDDGLNFTGGKRAIENFKLVDEPIREFAGTKVPDRVVRHAYVTIDPIEGECFADEAWCKCRSALQRSIVAASNIISVPIARPPCDHSQRRRRTRAGHARSRQREII